MPQFIETIIIGAGQAGLSISYYLKKAQKQHVILEKSAIAASWKERCWDSFKLATPTWTIKLPDNKPIGYDPNGFLTKQQIAAVLTQFAMDFQAPILYGIDVVNVEQKVNQLFLVTASNGEQFSTKNIVICTSAFNKAAIPAFSQHFPLDIFQIHSSLYKNPSLLPPGKILVVGAYQSGYQIAKELLEDGREVFLSIGSPAFIPRQYRGHDISYWSNQLGLPEKTVDMLKSPGDRFISNPAILTIENQQIIDFNIMADRGMNLLGRFNGCNNNIMYFDADVNEQLKKATNATISIINAIDSSIKSKHLKIPKDDAFETWHRKEYQYASITQLDIKQNPIAAIIWCSGYQYDFSWLKLRVFDQRGFPLHHRGETGIPGCYFLSLPWLYKAKSSLLFGISEDAAYIASKINSNSK